MERSNIMSTNYYKNKEKEMQQIKSFMEVHLNLLFKQNFLTENLLPIRMSEPSMSMNSDGYYMPCLNVFYANNQTDEPDVILTFVRKSFEKESGELCFTDVPQFSTRKNGQYEKHKSYLSKSVKEYFIDDNFIFFMQCMCDEVNILTFQGIDIQDLDIDNLEKESEKKVTLN